MHYSRNKTASRWILRCLPCKKGAMRVELLTHDKRDPRPDDARTITGPRDIRAVRTMRISVTDRCNFRCVYCMPAEKMDWVPRDTLLTFEEIATVAGVAVGLGIDSLKITGGEPLVRYDLPRLCEMLKALPGTPELSMTTNGALLTRYARALKEAGLDRLTVSLDTLNPRTFKFITRGAELAEVWKGIHAALDAGFGHPKINCVVMRGINDTELHDFAALTLKRRLTIRFIEYMPLGRTALGGEYEERFVRERQIREQITQRFGPLEPAEPDAGTGPAKVFRLRGARGSIGFISAMSQPFCETCNRLRLTAEGELRSCLFDGGEISLRPIVRSEASPGGSTEKRLREAFVRCVAFKPEVHAYQGNRQMSQIGG